MHRIDGAGHLNNRFTREDAASSRPPTEITDDWMNAVQEEVCSVIESVGEPLDKAANDQLLLAIRAIASGAVGNASEAVAGKVELATREETIIGAAMDKAINPAGLAAALAYFGIGTKDCIDRTDDLNTMYQGGFYLCSGPNIPWGDSCFLIVVTNFGNCCLQIAVPQGISKLFIRTSMLGAWSEWLELVSMKDANTWIRAQRGAVVPLADASTIVVDLSLSNNFKLTLGGSRTLGTPSNVVPGQSGVITVKQDATGGRALAFSTGWVFSKGIAFSLTTTPNAVDNLYYYVDPFGRVWLSIGQDGR